MLLAAWLLWSGHAEPLLLSFGLASILLVLGIMRRMQKFSGSESDEFPGPGILLYLPWLLWEILKSNIDVARIILDPKLPISPRLLHVVASQRTATGQVIYANSITLTPGTISLDVREGRILVHALTAEAAESLQTGEIDRRVSALERTH
jgi:multicomponent Na+:H+ antiporter subunit E